MACALLTALQVNRLLRVVLWCLDVRRVVTRWPTNPGTVYFSLYGSFISCVTRLADRGAR
jgi:hypothetical protein